MLMLGINACIGMFSNLYNPLLLAKLKKEGLLVTMNRWYLVYLCFFTVLCAIGMLVQCFVYKRDLSKEKGDT